MPLEENIVNEAIDSLAGETTEFLCDMIRIPSTRGNEGPVNRLVAERMKELCTDAELIQIPESFKDDPLYSWPAHRHFPRDISQLDPQCPQRCGPTFEEPGKRIPADRP
jgi:hypothetical protein